LSKNNLRQTEACEILDKASSSIGDHIELIYGEGLPERNRRGNKYPVYGSNGIVGFHEQSLVKGPGVIIGRKGTVGQVTLSKNDFWPIDTTYYVKLKEGNDLIFWFYLLQTLGLNKMNSHSAVPGLNRDNVYSVLREVPPLSKQRAIAKILYDFDEKIELNHQMNKTLEATVQVLFKRYFVDEGVSDYCRVADFVEFDPSISVRRGDILPFVDMKALSEEGMCIFNVGSKPFAGGAKFMNGDTLLARITPCLENGKTGYVNFLSDKTVAATGSTEFIVMRPKDGIPAQFVYCLARDPQFRECAIQSMIGSSGRQRVQVDVLADYKFVRPRKKELDKFDSASAICFQQIKKNREEIILLSQLRDSLLPKLLSGRTN